jgi:hypothetical protein
MFVSRSDYDDTQNSAPSLADSWRAVMRMVKWGLGVGLVTVIAGSILADATTERGTGASKVAGMFSPADRAAMRRAATAALTGDVATGSIKLDPCSIMPNKK